MQGLEDLIEPVADATLSGDLSWEEDGYSGFTVAVGAYHIKTWRWTDENDGSSGVSVSLKNKENTGAPLDVIVADEYSPRYERLTEFYNLARRSALNVDHIVSTLKQDLMALRNR